MRIRLRPTCEYGAETCGITHGSNHIRYVGPDVSVRLTTNAPLTYLLDETPFILEDEIVGGDVSMSMPHAWQVRFNGSGIQDAEPDQPSPDAAEIGGRCISLDVFQEARQ